MDPMLVSERLRSNSPPNPTSTLTCYQLTVVELGNGGGGGVAQIRA